MARAHRLTLRTVLHGVLPTVFAFFKNPYNLERITPPFLAFKVASSTDAVVREGTLIAYAMRLHGIPLGWESRIAEYGENSHFADEQLRGPYAQWHHRHVFRAVDGHVEMTDEVTYRLPFGPLGRLVHALVVRAQLRTIFAYRSHVITTQFGGHADAPRFTEVP